MRGCEPNVRYEPAAVSAVELSGFPLRMGGGLVSHQCSERYGADDCCGKAPYRSSDRTRYGAVGRRRHFVGMAKGDTASHTAGQCGNPSGRARPKRTPSTPCIFCEDASLIVEITKAASPLCGSFRSPSTLPARTPRVIPHSQRSPETDCSGR
jgi:hypothetical protein